MADNPFKETKQSIEEPEQEEPEEPLEPEQPTADYHFAQIPTLVLKKSIQKDNMTTEQIELTSASIIMEEAKEGLQFLMGKLKELNKEDGERK